jgi:hypothetical protein
MCVKCFGASNGPGGAKTAEELAHSKGADAVRWRTESYREIAANIAPLIKSGSLKGYS